jgi:serine/threonine protein kinase
MTMKELPELFPDGKRLGKYRLIRRLAVGGMAEIYLAQASGIQGFEKLVVLKRILPQHALDPQLLRMFLDEARLMATLTHPHLTQVYDVGSDGDAPFFAMEFVHGANLREIMNAAAAPAATPDGEGAPGGLIPLHHAIGILAAAAAGLHHAHDQIGAKGEPLNIVHRDVSPSNVLVTYEGSVKVSDFGIAKWSSQQSQTQEGALKGKFAYMSPEQCRGEPLDRRSDVFALGTLLYEVTTGNAPFRATSEYEILNQIVNGEVPPPTLPGGLPYPPELERIATRALARERADRYPTAQLLQLDLETFARDQKMIVSTVGLGQYMHTLFAQRLAGWRRAQQSGKSLEQHLAEVDPTVALEERGSRPTATDRFAPPLRGTRRRPARRTPALLAAALAVALAGGVAAALRLQTRSQSGVPVRRLGAASAGAGPSSPSPSSSSSRLSTVPPTANTVESHPASPPPATSAKPRRTGRQRTAAAVEPDLEPAPPAPEAAPPAAPAPPAALKKWDPDSPIPP